MLAAIAADPSHSTSLFIFISIFELTVLCNPLRSVSSEPLATILMRHLLLIFLTIVCTSCFAQQVTLPVANWKTFLIPTNEDTLYKYNSAPNDWTVFLKDNNVYATNNRQKVSDTLPFKISVTQKDYYQIGGRKSVLKVDDGYLVGFYRGEWGGNLYWFSNDGKSRYEISGHEIVQFIKRNDKIYAIEGLAHMNVSRGSIIEIKKANNKWIASDYIKLPSAPDGIDLDNKNNFIVITSESLLSVDTTSKLNTLIAKGFWDSYLYPTSIVLKNDTAYVGMRKGVFKFDLTTHTQEWLLNN